MFPFLFKISCDRETTFCLVTDPDSTDTTTQSPQLIVSRPKYTCLCKEGFYIPNETLQGFPSDKVESSEMVGGNYSCLPCPGGCLSCDKDGTCIYGPEESDEILSESVLRMSIGAIIGACMICCFLFALSVFRQRKCKVSFYLNT